MLCAGVKWTQDNLLLRSGHFGSQQVHELPEAPRTRAGITHGAAGLARGRHARAAGHLRGRQRVHEKRHQ